MTIEADIPENPNGVLYALGGAGGGLTCYVDDGYLCYEYNLFIIMRTKIRSARRLSPGRATIQIKTAVLEPKPGSPLSISMSVNGEDYGSDKIPISAPLIFSANDSSTSASASVGRYPSTTLTGHPSPSTAKSTPSTSATPHDHAHLQPIGAHQSDDHGNALPDSHLVRRRDQVPLVDRSAGMTVAVGIT